MKRRAGSAHAKPSSISTGWLRCASNRRNSSQPLATPWSSSFWEDDSDCLPCKMGVNSRFLISAEIRAVNLTPILQGKQSLSSSQKLDDQGVADRKSTRLNSSH